MDRSAEPGQVAGFCGRRALPHFARSLLLSSDSTAKKRPSNDGKLSGIAGSGNRTRPAVDESSGRLSNNPTDGVKVSGGNVSDETVVSDAQRIQTVTIAAAIIFACRGKESLEEALEAANEIFVRVVKTSK
jgi:hypothetical protein